MSSDKSKIYLVILIFAIFLTACDNSRSTPTVAVEATVQSPDNPVVIVTDTPMPTIEAPVFVE